MDHGVVSNPKREIFPIKNRKKKINPHRDGVVSAERGYHSLPLVLLTGSTEKFFFKTDEIRNLTIHSSYEV